MKPFRQFACWLALPLLVAGCTPAPKGPVALPEARPADFAIVLEEYGGPEDPHNHYTVTAKEASYSDQSEEPIRQWNFAPAAADLDELYATLRALEPHTLSSHPEEGKDQDRFGYKLTLTYGQDTLAVADQGAHYIELEADYNRFMDAVAAVHEFVGQGIGDQMIPLQVYLALDPKMPLPTALSVDLEERNLIELAEEVAAGDTLEGYAKPLSGSYNLRASATVDGKELKYETKVALQKDPVNLHLQLSAAGFVEAK